MLVLVLWNTQLIWNSHTIRVRDALPASLHYIRQTWYFLRLVRMFATYSLFSDPTSEVFPWAQTSRSISRHFRLQSTTQPHYGFIAVKPTIVQMEWCSVSMQMKAVQTLSKHTKRRRYKATSKIQLSPKHPVEKTVRNCLWCIKSWWAVATAVWSSNQQILPSSPVISFNSYLKVGDAYPQTLQYLTGLSK